MSDLFRSIQTALADRYQLERELGRGGMATVYLARELKHARMVAIKVLRPDLAGVMTWGRFLREIRISSELAHPHILPLLDSGTVPPTEYSPALPYYTMPYVDGESLRDRLKREKQLPLEDAVHIATDVAAALGYAHDHGVIHRDIKPENILLMGGHAVVADFGIARAIWEAVDPDAITSAGLVIGTPAYMSPEQAGGHPDIDGRSDLYSLGCVLYEMLGGEPPFTGSSPQAVLARHRMDHAPSLRTIRASVPASVEQAVMRALEKSPADRFGTAAQFSAALHDASTADKPVPAAPKYRHRLLLIGLVVTALGVLAWRVVIHRGPVLDSNKVVVFPLGETPAGSMEEGTGVAVALMISNALMYTEPLQSIDGLPRLDTASRRDASQITETEMRRIAQDATARWYVDGTVVRVRDSTTVVLRLNDAAGDSVAGRASATRVAPEAAQAGLAALNQLLPRLLAPGQRMADLSVLADRRPAAVAMWLQGEREYRSFNFAKALEFEKRAVAQDSALAVAAIRGAQAANWLNDMRETDALSDVAMRHISFLPGRMAPFARGLQAYVSGQADSAVHWLTQALVASPDWTEAHMALGEVYYHLLPSADGQLDSLAEVEFKAAATDSGFSPARYHLAELAIRSGDTTRAKEAVEDFLRLAQDDASREQRTELQLMLRCAREGRTGVDWKKVAAVDPVDVLRAGSLLAGGGAFPGCAEDAFRAVFDAPGIALGNRWGAFLGLQGILAAEGRTSALKALIDSAIAGGLDLADQLYVLDALGGVEVVAQARGAVARTRQARGGGTETFALWLAGAWLATTGDQAGMDSIRTLLTSRPAAVENGEDARFADALGARMELFRGDTAAAVRRLRTLLGTGRREELGWSVGGSLAPDRLLFAELLLAQGLRREAISAASVFDHPEAIAFLPYLPASLALRRRAALALGLASEAGRYESRLAALGESPRLGSHSPSSTGAAQ